MSVFFKAKKSCFHKINSSCTNKKKNRQATCIERLKTCEKKNKELKWNEQISVTQIVSPGVKTKKKKQREDKEFNYTISNKIVTGILSRDITIVSFHLL